MNCKEFVDFIMSYLNDELPSVQRSVFEQHIADCPPCITFLGTYRETVRLEKQAFAAPAVKRPSMDEAPETLVQGILAARRKGSK
jgi:anti-sigma factor RsiW